MDSTSTLNKICEFWPQTPTTGPSPREVAGVGREQLAHLFDYLGYRTGAEIGTERGLYARQLLVSNPNLKLYCVDSYKAYRGYREHRSQKKLDGFYDEAQDRLAEFNNDVEFIRKPSVEASMAFADESLDFVYIDANHSLLHVVQDLVAWVPKVKRDHIIAGHDFIRRAHSGYSMHVVQAVTAYTDSYGIKDYFVLGSKAIREGEVRDRPRSFFWIKG